MRFPTTWLRLTTGRLGLCRHGCQVTVKPQVRCISHSVFTVDVRGPSSRPLSSKRVQFAGTSSLFIPAEQQSCRTITSGRPGWYESIADSGPVHLTEQLLVFTQQTTGLPWWLSIICTTVTLRTAVTLPLAVYQNIIIAKVEALQKEIAELARRLRYEISVKAREKNWTEKTCRYHFRKNLRRIVSELYVRDNCHPFKASLLIWVQLPMWVCLSLALRNLSMGGAGSRGHSLVFKPHTSRLHLDHSCVSGPHQPAHHRDICPETARIFKVPEVRDQLHQRNLTGDDPLGCCSSLVDVLVLAEFQLCRTWSQPPSAFSTFQNPLQDPTDSFGLGHALQGHCGSFCC
ncbi:cytochrome c oxidase assembly protein COX18, mitochondrial isoform X2 [Hoplias malabaricus]|uniref:cytochrome c oxidase assembly protein COX18, mitochondrial isoform X2 n=1 Tax=Hoplias malabaricus TaxID=27720 RepID=UPI0034618FBA